MSNYTFTDRTTGKPVTLSNKKLEPLIASVIKHRAHNNIEYIEHEVAQEVAAANNTKFSGIYSVDPKKLINKPKLTIAAAKSACGALLNVARGEVEMNRVISKRWDICAKCPNLTSVSDCMTCGGAGRVGDMLNSIRAKFGKFFTLPSSASERYCGFCGCSMALLLPTLMKSQKEESDEKNAKRPDECWLKKTSVNYHE